jgi:DNA modification methylase
MSPTQSAIAIGTERRAIDAEFSPKAALAAVDWNFPARKSHNEIEGLHPYPAKFVAEIPRALLDALPIPPGASVFDPYCGSGTTVVECQKRGLISVGVDLNPIACLISRVKTSPLPAGIIPALEKVLMRSQTHDNPPIPPIPNLDHWFLRPIQRALASLREAIASAKPQYHDLFNLALSSIIVRVSNQESDTRYAAIEKNVDAKDVYFLFKRAVHRLTDALGQRDYPLSQVRVIESDTLELQPENVGARVGLVITSPPYPNAYEYWLYHKYRMWWLGYDPLAVKAHEIGARAHFFKGGGHHTAENFIEQMTITFRLLANVMVPGGYACFIVGRSKIHGAIIDNSAIVERAADKFGFQRAFSTERVLSPNRKSFNLSHANIKTETVLVLRFK